MGQDISLGTASGNALAVFCDTLFKDYKKNREALEEKWNSNREAVRLISSGKAWKAEEGEAWRSNTFIGTIKQKVTVAYSLIIDMVLAGGKIPFMLKPYPVGATGMDKLPEDLQAQINQGVEDMTDLIEKQTDETHLDRQMMKNILSLATYGLTFAKKTVMELTKEEFVKLTVAEDGTELPPDSNFYKYTSEVTKSPAAEYRSVWNIFRDIEEEDLKKSGGFVDADMVSPYWLRQKIGKFFYIEKAIRTVLNEVTAQQGASTANAAKPEHASSLPPSLRDVPARRKTIYYREFWIRAPRQAVEDFERGLMAEPDINLMDFVMPGADPSPILEPEPDLEKEPIGAGDEVEIMVCMANSHVVRFARVSAKDRPLTMAIFENALDETIQVGVADNLAHIQRVLNGAVRAFEDNKKLSANVRTGVIEQYLENPEDLDTAKPGQNIRVNANCDDIRKAIMPIVTPDVGETLLSVIDLFERWSEEESMLPKITQGVATQPSQTAYSIAQQIEKAGKYLGGVIKNIDSGLIEPIIQWYYEYNMLDPDVTIGKGNYRVQALGFTSFQDRYIRLGKIMQFMSLVMQSPELQAMVKLPWTVEELTKALDIDPDQALKSPEERELEAQDRAAAAANAAQAPKQPQAVDLAKIKQAEAATAKLQAETAHTAVKTDLELANAEMQAAHDMQTAIRPSVEAPAA